jgi:RNA polymerase sigma factor (sigma-70 family)
MSPPLDVSTHDPGDLFARARAGDQDAWRELFETCYPKVLRVVRRKLDRPMRSLYDSTDFASDVMKSLAAKFDKFDFPSLDSLHAYLVQAAKQKVIDEYRRRHTLKHDIGRERSVDWVDDGDPMQQALASGDPTASQEAQASEVHERLLADLDETEREIVELKHQGLSNSEVAEITGWHVRKVQRFLQALSDSISDPEG